MSKTTHNWEGYEIDTTIQPFQIKELCVVL